MTTEKYNLKEDQLTRLYDKICKTDTCWIWIGGLTQDGYPKFLITSKNYTNVIVRAHRLLHQIYYKKSPGDFFVCHKCNIKRCVNPEHLYLGTVKENSQDAARDGLFKHKLSDEDVKEIRRLGLYLPASEIGKKFKITRGHAYHIINNRRRQGVA